MSARSALARLLAAALLLAWTACTDEDATPPAEVPHAGHASLPGNDPVSGSSVYQLEGTWTDAAGARVGLAELRGRPVLAAMFYGTCEHVCPALVHDMKRIETRLAGVGSDDARFLLVTFDPEKDTPERLAAYARERDLDPARWVLLHGEPDQIRELALVLGVHYRPTGSGAFSHTSRITLLDREGAIVERIDGISQDPKPLLEPLRALLEQSGGRSPGRPQAPGRRTPSR